MTPARFLFVVPPLAGHINPTVAVGEELLRRGHEVAWCGPPAALSRHLAPEIVRFAAPAERPDVPLGGVDVHRSNRRGAAALKETFTLLRLLADLMLPDVREAIDTWQPDVLVSDQQTFAGAIAARERGLPWATSAGISFEFDRPLASLPKAKEWIRELLIDLQVDAGIPTEQAVQGDLRFSDHLVLAFTTEAVLTDPGPWPEHYVFVGPSLGRRTTATEFPWEWFDGQRPSVLVTLGTVNAEIGSRFYRTAVEALADMDVKGVIVAPDGLVENVPDHVLVRPWVPQVELLERVDAVVCHGGQNTVSEALAEGLPLVIAPIRDDQSQVAEQVVAANAGIRTKFGRVTTDQLRAAITEVLTEPSYRAAANRLADSFRTAGGTTRAADELERLATSTH